MPSDLNCCLSHTEFNPPPTSQALLCQALKIAHSNYAIYLQIRLRIIATAEQVQISRNE